MGRVGGLRVRCLLGAVPWPVVSRGVLVREFCSAGPFRPGGGGGGGIRRMPAAALIAVVSAVVSLLANQLVGLASDLVSSLCLFISSSWVDPWFMLRLAGFWWNDLLRSWLEAVYVVASVLVLSDLSSCWRLAWMRAFSNFCRLSTASGRLCFRRAWSSALRHPVIPLLVPTSCLSG